MAAVGPWPMLHSCRLPKGAASLAASGWRLTHAWLRVAPLARPAPGARAWHQLPRRSLITSVPFGRTAWSLPVPAPSRLSLCSPEPGGAWLRGAALALGVGILGWPGGRPPVRCEAAALPAAPPQAASGRLIAAAPESIPLSRRLARRLFHLARLVYLCCVFGPLLLSSPIAFWQTRSPRLKELWWCCCVAALERTGALVIKLAQWASSRPDLFGESVCARVEHLQDRTPPHSLAQTHAALDSMFGMGWRDYLRIEDAPIGSGCIAQVKTRGREVRGWRGACAPAGPAVTEAV